MFIQIGRVIMVMIWLAILSSPFTGMHHIYPLLLIAGGCVLALHAMQMLLIKHSLQATGMWKKSDTWQILFFGVFALLALRKRLVQAQRL